MTAEEFFKLNQFGHAMYAKVTLEEIKKFAEWHHKQGLVEGLSKGVARFAWWKDGTQYVGTCGTTLRQAMEEIAKEHGYKIQEL